MRTHKQPLPFTSTLGPVLTALGVVLLAVSPVAAQVSEIFPLNPPRQTYAEDVSSAVRGQPAGGDLPVHLDAGARASRCRRSVRPRPPSPAAADSGGPT